MPRANLLPHSLPRARPNAATQQAVATDVMSTTPSGLPTCAKPVFASGFKRQTESRALWGNSRAATVIVLARQPKAKKAESSLIPKGRCGGDNAFPGDSFLWLDFRFIVPDSYLACRPFIADRAESGSRKGDKTKTFSKSAVPFGTCALRASARSPFLVSLLAALSVVFWERLWAFFPAASTIRSQRC